MLSLLIGILAPTVGEKYAKPVAIGLLVLLAAGIVFAAVKIHDHNVIGKHEQKLERRAAPATNKAAEERANDTIANTKSAQEMHDVIAAQPDQPIAPTSHVRACLQLRRAGRSSAACPGPGSGH